MDFEILSPLRDVETIAADTGIRDVARLRRLYGRGRWRKMKGKALVRLLNGLTFDAEVHRYEAANVGKKEFKIRPPSV
jgi:hypothetical protein